MFEKIASSIFSMKNFFDEISIVDKEGIIRYCEISADNFYSFTADEIIGKHIFDVFTNSNEKSSEVYKVIQSGKPIVFFNDELITYKGDCVKGYSSIYPIFKDDELIGAAIAMKFLDSSFSKEFIKVFDEGKSIKSQGDTNYTIDNIVTNDPYMINIKNKINKISKTDSYVLIQGKTGTGKEVAAQAIHYSSNRADKPFISQNCAAIPSNLLESILFGTEKGSFTGAITNKGLFELADGGTLFLDEINSMDIWMQSKLLKSIEEKVIRRLGGHKNIKVDIRIIAAINEKPFDLIENNRLREDLFYRLNIISLKLSELKDRKNDISLLTDYYIKYYNKTMKRNILGLDSKVKEIFLKHKWAGNVRELRNVIESAFNLAEGNYITENDIPDYLIDILYDDINNNKHVYECNEYNMKKYSYDDLVNSYERGLILNALSVTKNKAEAAKALNMTRQAFNYKLDKLNLK